MVRWTFAFPALSWLESQGTEAGCMFVYLWYQMQHKCVLRQIAYFEHIEEIEGRNATNAPLDQIKPCRLSMDQLNANLLNDWRTCSCVISSLLYTKPNYQTFLCKLSLWMQGDGSATCWLIWSSSHCMFLGMSLY